MIANRIYVIIIIRNIIHRTVECKVTGTTLYCDQVRKRVISYCDRLLYTRSLLFVWLSYDG